MEYRDAGIKMIIVRRSERKGQFEEEAAGEYPNLRRLFGIQNKNRKMLLK